MKCVLYDKNIKVLVRAIQALSRVGDDIYIETQTSGFSIKTMNSNKSGFISVIFFPNFFTEFNPGDTEESSKCKILIKSCLNVFKNMNKVESCIISLGEKADKIIFKLICKIDTVKTHIISIMEQHGLQTEYSVNDMKNKVVASHTTFLDIVNNFEISEQEVTIVGSPEKIIAKNFIDATIELNVMKSQLVLKKEEFSLYSIPENISITFCLKELRALLFFAEYVHCNVNLYFDEPGKPVIFQLDHSELFEMTLTLATLPDDVIKQNSEMNANSFIEKRKELKKRIRSTKENKKNKKAKKDEESNFFNEDYDDYFNFDDIGEIENKNLSKQLSTIGPEISAGSANPNFIETQLPKNYLPEMVPSQLKTQSSAFQTNVNNDTQSEKLNSYASVKELEAKTDSEDIQVIFQDDTDDVSIHNRTDVICGSPVIENKKKKRLMFRRCFEATFNPNSLSGCSQILANKSDSESD